MHSPDTGNLLNSSVEPWPANAKFAQALDGDEGDHERDHGGGKAVEPHPHDRPMGSGPFIPWDKDATIAPGAHQT